MKKYLKTILLITFILVILLSTCSLAAPSKDKIKNINVNDINLNSINDKKVDNLKDVLNSIDITKLDSTAVMENIDKSEIATGNLNSVNVNAINVNEVVDIYDKLSEVISNEEIADLIKDNSELLEDAGLSSGALSASETLLRTFDSDAVIDIVKNDLDINKLLNMYKNGDSLEKIIGSIISDTSLQTKISILTKLLFANFYVRLILVILIIVGIYSVFITYLIFGKAGKKNWATFIPIYRDIVHLKVCGLSPWLLLLSFIPILGWLMLMAIAIIGRFELSKKFGHGFFFGLGLLVLPTLFRSIIAFSSNEYIEDLYADDE